MYINPEIFTGGAENRADKEMRCYALLDSLGVEYTRADHDFADTIEDCLNVEKLLGCEICKNLFLCNRQETEFYLLLIPGAKPFKTKFLSAQIGSSRLSFASAENMEKLLDITPGSVSVLGLMNDREKKVKLLIDRDLLKNEYIGCHPCLNSSTLKLKTADVIEKIIPAMEHGISYVDLPREV